jgi:hypothetical protein
MKNDQVLEEYQKGDSDKRLSLFLYYRELRDEFSRIELDDSSDLFAAAATSGPMMESMLRKLGVMLRTGFWSLRSRTSGGRIIP